MKKIFFLALSSLLLASCSKSDSPFVEVEPVYNYTNGVLFVNEGNFQGNNASIGFANSNLNSIEADIYSSKERVLGDVAQSIGFNGDYAYIVVNGSNKIEIVNRYNFKAVATISDNLNAPRYTAFANDKLYVTNAASESVSIFDIKTNKFIGEIKLNTPVEHIVSESNKIYVQQANYGIGNKIAVIDSKTDAVIKTLELEDSVQGLVSHIGFVYAISSIETRSNFYKINTLDDSFHISFTTTAIRNARNLRVDNNMLYYTSNNNVFSWKMTATELNYTPLFAVKGSGGFEFMYAFDVVDDQFYITNAGNFREPSTVEVYNLAGKMTKTFKGGITTNHFYKN